MLLKVTCRRSFSAFSTSWKRLSVAHNEEKYRALLHVSFCSYVNLDIFVSRLERLTFSLSQTNNVELARTLSWRENALFEEREKNNQLVRLFTCLLTNLSTRQLTSFCQLFSGKFNIISTLSGHQSPTLPQKNDSREGLFWCQKGLVCEYDKMNIYFKEPPFALIFGYLVLNVVQYGAKRSAFRC